jgi:hypothetical protein
MDVQFTRDELFAARPYEAGWLITGTDTETGDLITALRPHDEVRALIEAAYEMRQDDTPVTLDIGAGEVTQRLPLRVLAVTRTASGYPTREQVAAYLPGNYTVAGQTPIDITITGHDTPGGGFSAEGFVIPRLASGMIACRVVPKREDEDAPLTAG